MFYAQELNEIFWKLEMRLQVRIILLIYTNTLLKYSLWNKDDRVLVYLQRKLTINMAFLITNYQLRKVIQSETVFVRVDATKDGVIMFQKDEDKKIIY